MIERTCPSCGAAMTASICGACGWDLTTEVVRMARPPLGSRIWAVVWRVLILGLIIVVPLVGSKRLLDVGPGPDLPTTLRWLVLGDDGRAAELVTLHRAYEIAGASARFAIREFEAPSFEGNWQETLAPYATMNARGWIPLLFIGATTDSAPSSVKEFYAVKATDGWGRPYQVRTRAIPRTTDVASDAEIQEDLAAGLNQSFAVVGKPDFGAADWLRLELVSAARDGVYGSADDITFISYVAVGFTLELRSDPDQLQRKLEEAFAAGRQFFRFVGARWDLIDARLLAEFRVHALS